MGQIRHGGATTTHAVRAAIQRSQASLARLSAEFGVWDRIFQAISKAYDGDPQMIDSTSIRVHQHAANVKKGGPAKRRPRLGTSLQADASGAREAD